MLAGANFDPGMKRILTDDQSWVYKLAMQKSSKMAGKKEIATKQRHSTSKIDRYYLAVTWENVSKTATIKQKQVIDLPTSQSFNYYHILDTIDQPAYSPDFTHFDFFHISEIEIAALWNSQINNCGRIWRRYFFGTR